MQISMPIRVACCEACDIEVVGMAPLAAPLNYRPLLDTINLGRRGFVIAVVFDVWSKNARA